jgi:threonine 3-dehydrogenase
MRLLDQHGPRLAPMVTHRLPLARVEEGFALARSKAASKVLVFPEMS